jgi:tRNA (cmo5U34)-methyltransferase
MVSKKSLVGELHLVKNYEDRMKNNDGRFGGFVGEDYELVIPAFPNYHNIQTLGVEETRKHTIVKDAPFIIEIGCGTGETTQLLHEAIPNATIFGIDNEPAMLEQARTRFKEIENPAQGAVEFFEFDALQYVTEHRKERPKCDIIISAQTTHNFENSYRREFYKGAFNCLWPGGTYIAIDKIPVNDEAQRELHFATHLGRIAKTLLEAERKDLSDYWLEHSLEDNKPERIQLEGETLEKLSQTGFRDVQIAHRMEIDAVLIAYK